jgi:hypothetical protein
MIHAAMLGLYDMVSNWGKIIVQDLPAGILDGFSTLAVLYCGALRRYLPFPTVALNSPAVTFLVRTAPMPLTLQAALRPWQLKQDA